MSNTPPPPPRNYRVSCPHCSAKLNCTAKVLGMRVRCSSCGHEFVAPELILPGVDSNATTTINYGHKPIDRSRGQSSTVGSDGAFPKINTSPPSLAHRNSANKVNRTRQTTTLMIGGAIAAVGFLLSILGDFSKMDNYGDTDPMRIVGRAVLAAIVLPIFIGVYVMPSMIAFNRGHRNAIPILVVNVFAGAFLLPWVGCLAWALSSHVEESRQTVRVIRVNERDKVIDL